MTTDDFTKQYAIRQPDGKLEQLQISASRMGVEWLATIETRLCTPFSVTDPSEQMIAELEAWRREQ
ncbi:hypothetical protein ACT17_20680 [Mycolicibacterium conceptionense]|jgi:hypothetical protein|uniref:Uncharacterized protein n=2 Tax=Mycolicibacterium TaxID=1866885 RepID=A0ABR5G1D8_9MYCO|nr:MULTISPECIES: hypothetical protein [Mycolicibacterium]KLI04548.1 hypothetical protein AA982_29645 [Mycolicibacterium senegalense]KLO53808.1 hypothetical protein ABW05_22285 [Mycolicibacterium senegalense]KMV16380.1 hypothetical protein ACT17_20680 [Mycolicibacterium conceptionense]